VGGRELEWNAPELETEQEIIFQSGRPGNQQMLSASTVVERSSAIQAVNEFWVDPETRPLVLSWFEL